MMRTIRGHLRCEVRTLKHISVVVFALGFLLGCASTASIPTLVEEPDCMTSLEGYYHCKEVWAGPTPPAIVVVTGGASGSKEHYKAIQAETVSLDDRGLTIKPKVRASFLDSVRTHYELSELKAVIDEDGEIVYGSIPTKFSSARFLELYLEPFAGSSYSSGSKQHRLRLTPNERFAFCFPSGTYKVSEIHFVDGSNHVEFGVDCPDLRITVSGGRSNYIGDLFLDIEKSEAPDRVRIRDRVSIPYRVVSASDSGWMGGGVGSALSVKSGVAKRELLVGIDDAFAAQCGSPLTTNIIEHKK